MPPRYRYDAFGLAFYSAVRLPAFPAPDGAVPGTSNGATPPERTDGAAVRIERRDLPDRAEALPDDATLIHTVPDEPCRVYDTGEAVYWLHRTVGTLRVGAGSTIEVDPAASASSASVGRLIRGPGVRSLFVQRGYLVVHASVVDLGGTTVAFTGDSGTGKSTMAAACYARGHRLLADDLAVMAVSDGTAECRPGYPSVHVDDAAATALDLDGDRSRTDSVSVDVSDRFHAEPATLDAVCHVTDGDDVAVRDRPPGESVYALLRTSWTLYGEDDVGEMSTHLDTATALASHVSVCDLVRPRELSRLSEVVAVLEAEFDE